LRIKTTAGETYLSDFVPVNVTPPIDSVKWTSDSTGVQLYVSTHNPANNTRYYKWDFAETWEFHSPFVQQLRYDTVINPANGKPVPGIAFLPYGLDSAVYFCWQSAQSTQLLLGSSANLSQDVITDFPLNLVPPSSVNLTIEYSTLVNQYALTENEFNFLSTMQKNTEETGSVFGAEPTSLQGNIHSLTHPSETVVGYVGFSTIQSKRIFIDKNQLPAYWKTTYPGCVPDSVLTLAGGTNPYYQIENAVYSGLVPIMVTNVIDGSIQFVVVAPPCVNCVLNGGTNIKPSFWQ